MKTGAILLSLSLAAAVAPLAEAQTTADLNSQVTTMNNLTTTPGQTNVVGKISGDFNSFLGSNGSAVVTGLRNGTPITLTSTTSTANPTTGLPPVTTTNTTVITPPTGPMGYGNVYISLALAKQQLSTMGITQPTPEQLQAALTGGTVTQTTGTGATATTTSTDLRGVLTMRSEGMGWGQIAQKLDTKLGPVMSSMKSANKSFASASASAKGTPGANKTTAPVNSAGNSGSSGESGIVSAGGKSQAHLSNGASAGKKDGGDGIVTAAGRSGGHAYGQANRSIVTGSGRAAGSGAGIVSAGGHGKGTSNGKGHDK
jgi:hypothetical protein